MPPRKSIASTTSAIPTSPGGAGDTSVLSTVPISTTEPKSPTTHKTQRQSTAGDGDVEKSEKKKSKHDDLGIDDLLLPRTLTSRLARGTLPPNTSIQRDALLALAKSATVFISYLSHTANNLTSRKTIQSNDILEALRETELWNVVVPGSVRTLGERVQAEVEKWEDEVKGKRKGYRDRVKARESNVQPEDGEEGRGPLAKRVRRSDADGDTTMDAEGDADGDGDDDADTDAAAAQLRGEDAVANRDGTETDPEVGDEGEGDEDIDDEEQEEEEDEDQDPEEGDEDDDAPRRQSDDLDVDTEDDSRRRIRSALAPNGRVEVGSDEESD